MAWGAPTSVLVIYRDDHRLLLDPIIPRRGGAKVDYDLVIASRPYRARSPIDFKVSRVIALPRRRRPVAGHSLARQRLSADPQLPDEVQ